MNSLPLDQLLREPESKTLEFKRDLSSPKPLLKTLVAFANTAGGRRRNRGLCPSQLKQPPGRLQVDCRVAAWRRWSQL